MHINKMDFYNGNNILFCRNVQIQPNFFSNYAYFIYAFVSILCIYEYVIVYIPS